MLNNVHQSDAGKMTIVASPVVVIRKEDAVRAARLTPIVERPDHENIVIVAAMITAEGVIARLASLIITHHVQSKRSKKSSVAGSWRVDNIPVLVGADKHVFHLAWPPEEKT